MQKTKLNRDKIPQSLYDIRWRIKPNHPNKKVTNNLKDRYKLKYGYTEYSVVAKLKKKKIKK